MFILPSGNSIYRRSHNESVFLLSHSTSLAFLLHLPSLLFFLVICSVICAGLILIVTTNYVAQDGGCKRRTQVQKTRWAKLLQTYTVLFTVVDPNVIKELSSVFTLACSLNFLNILHLSKAFDPLKYEIYLNNIKKVLYPISQKEKQYSSITKTSWNLR